MWKDEAKLKINSSATTFPWKQNAKGSPRNHGWAVNNAPTTHLFVVFGEELTAGGLVDGLSDSDDLSIAVADGHAQEGLGLVPGQLVDFIAEATILQIRSNNTEGLEPSQGRKSCSHMATHITPVGLEGGNTELNY